MQRSRAGPPVSGLDQLGDAISETRRVSHDLKSVLLKERRLPEALEYICREFAGRTQVQCDEEDAKEFQSEPLAHLGTRLVIGCSRGGVHSAVGDVQLLAGHLERFDQLLSCQHALLSPVLQ